MTTPGEFVNKALIPAWVLPVVGAVLAAALMLGSIGLLRAQQGGPPPPPTPTPIATSQPKIGTPATTPSQPTPDNQATVTAQNNATATAQANGKTQADATATAQANATATAQANATATATALQNPNPYGGKLAFQDTLANNTNGWCLSIDAAEWNFSGGVLHLLDDGASGASSVPCIPQNASLDFSNSAFQVQMKVLKGFGGGIIFRSDSNFSKYYSFLVGTDGSYKLEAENGSGSPASQTIKSGSSSAILTGVNQTNFVAVVAQGSALMLYVNQQFITSINDGTYTHGTVGLFAYDSGHPNNPSNPPVEVVFSNAKVWTL